jgi:hypothetical protein
VFGWGVFAIGRSGVDWMVMVRGLSLDEQWKQTRYRCFDATTHLGK